MEDKTLRFKIVFRKMFFSLIFQVRIVKQGVYVEGGDVVPSALLTPANQIKSPVGSTPTKSPGGAGGLKRKRVRKEKSEEVEEPLSTDLQCYFQCDEVFKKDYQLHLHLKLRHRDEPPELLEKAYEAANEEIALTRLVFVAVNDDVNRLDQALCLPLQLRPLPESLQRCWRLLWTHSEQT